MSRRVVRFPDTSTLVTACARRLLDALISVQAKQDTVNLCLTGGRTANQLYAQFGSMARESDLDPARLQLWWADEGFVALTHPDRNSQQALAILAKSIQISPANTHLMPAVDGKADPTEAAFAYAGDLGDVTFDICLLGLGIDGHVASVFPGHPSFSATGKVIGVSNAPKPPSERVSLTLSMLNLSRHIWCLASGDEKAEVVSRVVANDLTLPASHVCAQETTILWLDEAAASKLQPSHSCAF